MRSKTQYVILLAMMIILPVGVIGMDQGSDFSINDATLSPTRAPSFTNISEEVGLAGYRGDNLAWGDYNNDLLLDLLVRGPSSNYLFQNNGGGGFDEVSNETGVNITRGYSQWADYNGDGYLDFYTAGIDDHLFRNNGPPNWDFTDVTATAGNPSDGVQSEGIAWGDYNRDGYPDIFTVGWRKPGDLQWPYAGEMDRLYKNNGDGTFTDVSIAAGLNDRATSYAGMGVVWCDPNEDGWQDIYVSNYHVNPNELWINDRDGTFTESAFEYNLTGKETFYQGNNYYGHSNGAGWADFDNDQDMDVWVSHLAHKDDERSGMNRGYYCADSQLFENSGPPYLNFTDIRVEAGIPITPSGTVVTDPDSGDMMWKDEDYFGVAWGDMENDGDLDLWVPQVKTYSFWDHSFLWENNGDKTFSDSTDTSNLKVWSNTGGTWVDYDNDGDLDFCTEGTYPFRGPRELHLFRNPGNSNHWIEFNLISSRGASAIGSKVVVKSGDLTLTRYVGGDCGGHGFQQPLRLHFGLGSRSTIDEIWIYWTSGRIQKLSGMPVDAIYTIHGGGTIETTMTWPGNFEVVEDEMINIDIQISGGAISEMYWDMDNDRDFEFTVISSQLTRNYSTEGWRWLRFRVKDSNAFYWDLEPILVKVSNVPPTVSLDGHLTYFEEEEIVFTPQVIDTSSDLVSMRYEWYMDDILISTDPILVHSIVEMGTYDLVVKVTDDNGETSSDGITIEIENQVPIPTLSHSGNTTEGEKVYLYCDVEDSSLDIADMEYLFHSGDGRKTNWQDLNWTQFTYEEDGEFRPAVEVRDRHGDDAVVYQDLSVLNVLPTISASISTLELEEDEEYQFEVDVSDVSSDIDDLETRFDMGDGTTSDWSASKRFRHSYSQEGTYEAYVKVKDDDAIAEPLFINVTVTDPDPELGIDDYVATEIFEESTISFSGWIRDNPSDEDEMEHRWDLGDGNVTLWSDGEIIHTHRYMMEGTYNIKLEMKDAEGDIFNSTHIVIVRNLKPETTLHSSKSSPNMDEEVTFSARDTEDTDMDLLKMTYRWTIEGNTFQGPAQIKHVFRSSGTETVSLEAFDGTEYSEKETMRINVNNPVPVIYLDAPKKTLTTEIVILDARGTIDTITDQPNLTYSFDMGDGSSPVSSNSPVVNYTYLNSGTYTIILTVMDSGLGSTLEHNIEVTDPPSTSTSSNSGAIVVLVIVVVLAVLIVAPLGAVLVIKRKREVEGPPAPVYPQGRAPPMRGPQQIPPQRPPPPVQQRPQQPNLPPPGSSVPPPPQQPN